MTTREVMMAAGAGNIQFVGSRAHYFDNKFNDTTYSITGLTGGIGSAPQTNDIVLAFYSNTGGIDSPVISISGYTQLSYTYRGGGNYSSKLVTGYKLMGSTPDTTITVSGNGGGSNTSILRVLVFRGVNLTTPIDVTTQTGNGLGTYLVDPPSITPVTSNALIVAGGMGAVQNGSGGLFTSSDLSNFVVDSYESYADPPPGPTLKTGFGTKLSTGGAFNPSQFGITVSSSTSSTTYASVTIALRPA